MCENCKRQGVRTSLVVLNVMWRRDPAMRLRGGTVVLRLCRLCERGFWAEGLVPARDKIAAVR